MEIVKLSYVKIFMFCVAVVFFVFVFLCVCASYCDFISV